MRKPCVDDQSAGVERVGDPGGLSRAFGRPRRIRRQYRLLREGLQGSAQVPFQPGLLAKTKVLQHAACIGPFYLLEPMRGGTSKDW